MIHQNKIQVQMDPVQMLLDGYWKNNKKETFIIQCLTQPLNGLWVRTEADSNTAPIVVMECNGSYYSVKDGWMVTFHLFDKTLKTYSGKLYSHQPTTMYLEEIITNNNAMEHYKQVAWSLYDECQHENLIFTKINGLKNGTCWI